MREMTKKKSSTRRMAQPGSESWHAMLDGAEVILRDEGYCALTSRRVAEQIGVKQRLVYYYFQTMDDLIVETFKRLSRREMERLEQALASPDPLRQIWNICIHTSDARLIAEFMALANRNKALRKEVVAFIETSREMQVTALCAALERRSTSSEIPAAGLAMIATSLALSFTRERGLGIGAGHRETLAVIEGFLSKLEPAPTKGR